MKHRRRCFVLIVVVAGILAVVVFCLGFRRPTVPLHIDYEIAIESKLGRPIDEKDCWLIFEEQRKYYLFMVHGPETHWTGRKNVLKIAPYDPPVVLPRRWEYGILYGPHVRSDMYLTILLRGHSVRYVHVGYIAADVEFHENPTPLMSTDEDLIIGATYYMTPLLTDEEFYRNTDEIKRRCGIDESHAGIAIPRKMRGIVEKYLLSEENEMTQLLEANRADAQPKKK